MQSISRFIYGVPPAEKLKNWQTQLRKEQRQLDKEIRELDQVKVRTQNELKKLVAKGDVKSARMLAKEIVRSNKQTDRLHVSKARLSSVGMQLTHQAAMLKVTGTLHKSVEIMKLSNQLIKLPELNATMRQMSMEMMKAGIMEEMMEDTLEGMDQEDEEMEDEANEEVDKVLFALTDGKFGKVGEVGTALPAKEEVNTEQESEAEMARMQKELHDLLSN